MAYSKLPLSVHRCVATVGGDCKKRKLCVRHRDLHAVNFGAVFKWHVCRYGRYDEAVWVDGGGE